MIGLEVQNNEFYAMLTAIEYRADLMESRGREDASNFYNLLHIKLVAQGRKQGVLK